MANIVVSNITSTSITLYVNDLDTTYDRADRYIKWRIYPSTTVVATSYLGANVSSGGTATITGLSPNTTYQISAEIFWTDGSTGEWYSKIQLSDGITTTNSTGTIPSKFSWTKSNGTATATQTATAYTAVTTNGYTTDFSYLVWNDIVEKVNEIITYLDGDWLTKYASLANTKMTSTDKDMTAVRYNSLLYNIWAYCITDISAFNSLKQNKEDDVLGSYFTNIVTYINNTIDTL